MPSTTELLEENLRRGVAMLTRECDSCKGGECTQTHEGAEAEDRCWNCGDTMVCSQCVGGIISPDPYSEHVYMFVVPAALTLIACRRDKQDFPLANVALDWLLEYSARYMTAVIARDEVDLDEAVRKGAAAVAEGERLLSTMATPLQGANPSALSPQEIYELVGDGSPPPRPAA